MKRKTKDLRNDIEDVPIVYEYKYLGITLDSSLTLGLLAAQIKSKVKKCNQKIRLIFPSIAGIKAKYNLW